MQNQTTGQSFADNSTSATGRRLVAASKNSSSNSSLDKAHPAKRTDGDVQPSESLTSLLQHAYQRLLAGDAKEARRALERALEIEERDALPIVNTSTERMQSSQKGQVGTTVEPRIFSNEDVATPAPPIVIKTLGKFEVHVDGEIPGAKRKPPHLLLGMLKVLIANGGCSVNRSLLLDALWPDLDGDRANDAQQVALHRLRRLLGHSDALFINHGYISINPQLVEVDAFILDTLCRNPFITGHEERASTALDLYRGTFLPDELDSPWSQRMRECMRAKFVNIVAAAGKDLESNNDYAGAAALYEQALTIDDLENIIREGLLRVLRQKKVGRKRKKTELNSAVERSPT